MSKVIYNRFCRHCNVKFKAMVHNQVYCNKKCKNTYFKLKNPNYNKEYYQRTHNFKDRNKKCPLCDKKFKVEKNQLSRRYCFDCSSIGSKFYIPSESNKENKKTYGREYMKKNYDFIIDESFGENKCPICNEYGFEYNILRKNKKTKYEMITKHYIHNQKREKKTCYIGIIKSEVNK